MILLLLSAIVLIWNRISLIKLHSLGLLSHASHLLMNSSVGSHSHLIVGRWHIVVLGSLTLVVDWLLLINWSVLLPLVLELLLTLYIGLSVGRVALICVLLLLIVTSGSLCASVVRL